MADTKVIVIPDGKICDYIDSKFRNDTPEEYVRQTIEKRLVNEHKYLTSQIKIEFTLQVGSRKPRADIVIWDKDAPEQTQGTIKIIIECKKETVDARNAKDGIAQLQSYMSCLLYTSHDYPAAEDEERVKLPEQVPVERLQTPNEVAQQQGKQRFLRAGQDLSLLLDKADGRAVLRPDADIGRTYAEVERRSVLEVIVEGLRVALALPGDLDALAAADEVALARARGAHGEAACVVDDGDVRREEEQILEGHLHARGVVHVLGAVFIGVVEPVVVVILKAGGLEAVVAYLGIRRLVGALVGGVLGEGEAVVIGAALVREGEALVLSLIHI